MKQKRPGTREMIDIESFFQHLKKRLNKVEAALLCRKMTPDERKSVCDDLAESVAKAEKNSGTDELRW